MDTMNKHTGFTLVELMIGLAIAAIVMTLGVPSFRDLIQNNRVTTTTNEIVLALQMGRSEAAKRGQSITVCASADGDTCSGATNWATGWIVTTGASDEIRVTSALSGGLTLTGSASQVVFRSAGDTAAGLTLTLSFSGCTGDRARAITVAASGQPTSDSIACP